MVQGNIPKLQTWPPDGATCPLQAKDSATIWCLIWSSIGSNFGHQAELPALISNCAIRRSRLPLLFRPRQSVKDKLSSILYYMITPQLSHPINNIPPPPHYICVFRRSEWKWMKIPQQKRSQNVAIKFFGGLPPKTFFSYLARAPRGIFWQERYSGVHLEHPEKVFFFCPKEAERGWKSDATPL